MTQVSVFLGWDGPSAQVAVILTRDGPVTAFMNRAAPERDPFLYTTR